MKTRIALGFAALLVAAIAIAVLLKFAPFPDDIDTFAQKFDPNGESALCNLPDTPDSRQAVDACAKCYPEFTSLLDECKIIKTKSIEDIHSPMNGYTVTEIESNKGRKIFIVYQQEREKRWSIRPYAPNGNTAEAD